MGPLATGKGKPLFRGRTTTTTKRPKQCWFPFNVIQTALYDDSFLRAPVFAIFFNVILVILLSIETRDDSILLDRGLRMIDLVSASAITIVTLTFSLTVLSVQIAAGSYSPRLLEDFLKDPISKLMFSVNTGAYAYCYALTYYTDVVEEVPWLAIHGLTVHMGLILLGFVGYIHFFLDSMRLDEILQRAADASRKAARTLSSGLETVPLLSSDHHDDLPPIPSHAYKVLADKSGYITKLSFEDIVEKVRDMDICVRYCHYIGDFCNEGTVICLVWDAKRRTHESSFADRVDKHIKSDKVQSRELNDRYIEEKLGKLVNKGIRISERRDSDYDVTLGIQQLVDTAVRALSAAVNDPQTAIQCMDVLSPLILELANLELGVPHSRDEDNFVRICSPRRSLSFLLCMLDPIRRYGGADLSLCRRALRFFGDIAAVLSRCGRYDRIPAAVAQLDEWMRVSRENFAEGTPEIATLLELYCHILEGIAESKAMIMGNGRFRIRDTEDFENLHPLEQPSSETLLQKSVSAKAYIQKAIMEKTSKNGVMN